ncbi:hypothetical protein I4U23_004042 [Adineta vaga]|nr:hypothetical protein I4U23_004042 [Adineta vaga]
MMNTTSQCSKTSFVQQLNQLLVDHDDLKHSINFQDNSSLKVIDEWEQQSIEKIQRTANDHRQDFKMKTEKYKDHLLKRSNDLYEELMKAQKSNDLMESDLKNWSNKLDKLRISIQSPPKMTIQNNEFISKLSIHVFPNDIFDISAGDLQIINHGQTVIHGSSVSHAVVRGSEEYSTGKHHFHFRIESFNNNKWLFFGIISNKSILQSHTWAIPSCYGWGGQDSAILNCAMHSRLNGYVCDFELNDIIELILDCDMKLISLANQRTKCIYTMNIDINKCPFPWHFILNLFYPNDQVCILYRDTL